MVRTHGWRIHNETNKHIRHGRERKLEGNEQLRNNEQK